MKNKIKKLVTPPLSSISSVGTASAVIPVAGLLLALTGSASAITAGEVVTVVTGAASELDTVFVAGLAIVGGFFVWRILKKALKSSA